MGRCALLIACAVVVGPACDNDAPAPVGDLGVTIPDLSTNDSAPADLAPARDLTVILDMALCAPPTPRDGFASSADAAGLCDGTTIAGTCAQAFFTAFATCYVPAGCRVYHRDNNTRASWDFASGASIFWDATGIRSFSQNGHSCAFANSANFAQDDQWTLSDGTKLTINWTSGNVTCPDGTQIQISNPRSCDALNTLMLVPPLGSDPGCCLP